MARKDISDRQVCEAYEQWNRDREVFVDALLMESTGEPEKVVYSAMERAVDRDLVEFGCTMRSGWLTDKGRAMLSSAPPDASAEAPPARAAAAQA